MDRCRTQPPGELLGSKLANVKSADGVKFTAENGSWLMLRGSGTEPILRIIAEAPDKQAARQLIAQCRQAIS